MCRSALAGAVAALAIAFGTHAAAAPILLHDQADFGFGTGPEAARLLSVSDFVLAAPASVSSFKVWMKDGNAAFGGGDGVADGVFRSFSGVLSWYFFANADDAPGALVAAGSAVAPAIVDTGVDTVLDIDDVFEITVNLPEIALGAGRGWFGVREGAVGSAYDGTSITWMASQTAQGAGRHTFFDGASLGDLDGPFAIDGAFQLVGQTVPEPAPLALMAAAALAILALRRPRRQALAAWCAAAAFSPAAQAAGATQFVYAPIACRTFDGALWIYPNGQIGNKHPSQTMRVLCPLIHEAKSETSDAVQISIVNANRNKRLRCRVFFNHPHANVEPPSFVTGWQGAQGNSAGIEDATLRVEGHKFLGGSHMLECEIPPKSNESRFEGVSRIGTYKSGVD